MPKFGFDYFVKRQEVLSEMARPAQSLLSVGPAGKKMAEYIATINGVMRRGGTYKDDNGKLVEVPGLPSGKGSPIQSRTNRYIIYVISGLSDDFDPLSDSNEKEEGDFSDGDELTRKAIAIYGYPGYKRAKIPGKPGSMKIYSLAIEKWTKDNQEEVMSEEFKNKLTSEENILKFLTPFRRKALHSPYGQLKASEKEELYGMETEEYHRIISKIAPYLKRIHQLKGYNKLRKTPIPTVEDAATTGSTTGVNNNATENVAIVLYSIENIVAAKALIGSAINNNIDGGMDFENILNVPNPNELSYEEREALRSIIRQVSEINQKALHNRYNEQELKAIMKLYAEPKHSDLLGDMMEFFGDLQVTGLTVAEISKELDFYKSLMLDSDVTPIIDSIKSDVSTYSNEDKHTEYVEYPTNILKAVLNTSELVQAFDDWYKKIFLPYRINSLQTELSNREADKAGTNAIPGEHAAISNREKKIKELEQKYENPEYEGDITSEYQESYVMGYMTEQISKDRFSPNGEFKDRGFKKPQNYSQWLMIND